MSLRELAMLVVSAVVCEVFRARYAKMKRERDSFETAATAWRCAAEGWERTATEWRAQATWLTNRSAPAPNGKAPVIHHDVDPGFGLDVLEDGTTDMPEKVPPKKLC